MLGMLFLICFNYSALRNLKDALIITASGAEVIPFIKVWAILPGAIALTLVFTKLSSYLSQEKVFYVMTSGFLVVYTIFAFAVYPVRDLIHPQESADALQQLLPLGMRGLVSMYRHWTLTIFYVMSELWSSIVMTVLFWGFANEVTRLHEARRFYGVLSVAANFASVAAGLTSMGIAYLSSHYLMIGLDSWDQSVQLMMGLIILNGFLVMALFRWMNCRVLNEPAYDEVHQAIKPVVAKRKLSFRESIAYVSSSKYLICIAVVVVAYNLTINLVEVVWKDQLKNLYPSPQDYNHYVNNLTAIQGVLSTILAVSMAWMLRSFGWTKTALITPIVMLLTCSGFFGLFLFEESLGGFFWTVFGMTPAALAVFFGAAQNAMSKACKYSVFDTTKEMTYIPLDHESKLKGKAAIDGVGSRLGKSGGSIVHQGLLMLLGSVSASAPFVAGFLLLVIILWVIAVRSLGVRFDQQILQTANVH